MKKLLHGSHVNQAPLKGKQEGLGESWQPLTCIATDEGVPTTSYKAKMGKP